MQNDAMEWVVSFIYEREKLRTPILAKEEIWQHIPKLFKNVKLHLTSHKWP